MLVNHMGETVLEHVNHMHCKTKVKMDNLWECLAEVPTRCPDLITYGPGKYCVQKDHVGFGVGAARRIEGTLK